ncbi:HlyD family secretion protein [Clostridium thermarum]|uniref:HlyD family secretion protein n=1 Tax=Clostridium thermarum TaxID=1716543 RepID=UPI00111D2825|nr:HlyD family efflux transporter periplasmic adaptor subunit [Clostridium thermarum]
MRAYIQDLNSITDSREMLERKPHSFIVSFIYIFIAVILVALTWSYFGEIDEYVKASGVVRPGDKTAAIRNTVTGKVDKVNIDEGKTVKKGDILYTIEAKGLIINREETKKQIEKLTLEIENLVKLKESIKSGKNLFDKNNEKEAYYYNRYLKYVNDKESSIEQIDNALIDFEQAMKEAQLTQKAAGEKLEKIKITLSNLDELKTSIENDTNMINPANLEFYEKFNNYLLNKERLQRIHDQKEIIYNSYSKLYEVGGIARREVEDIKNQLDMASMDLRKYKSDFLIEVTSSIEQNKNSISDLENSIEKAKLNLDTYAQKGQSKEIILEKYYLDNLIQIEDTLTSNRNNLDNLQSELKNIELNLEETTVVAPIDGVVNMYMEVNSGELLQAGSEVATIITDADTEYKVQIYVYNKDIANIKLGQTIKYRFQALPYSEYGDLEGVVTRISTDARVDKESGANYYIVEASLENKPLYSRKGTENSVKIGMTCEAQVITDSKKVLYWLLEKINLKD